MARSLGGLLHTDLGFRADGITAFQITSMDTSAAARVRRQELIARLEAEPGVEAVTMTPWRPFDLASAFLLGVRALDETDASARAQDVELHSVSASYFRALDIPLVSGRTFTDADTVVATQRVVLSESARETPVRYAIGDRQAGRVRRRRRQAHGSRGRRARCAIQVGRDGVIASDVCPLGRRRTGATPQHDVVCPRDDADARRDRHGAPHRTRAEHATFHRGRAEPQRLCSRGDIEHAIRGGAARRIRGECGAAGGVGIYGVVSYIVSQRMREFGVRLVLGANGRDLLLATVRRSVWLTGGGVAVGLVAAAMTAQLLRSFLYGVGTFDVLTYLGVVVMILCWRWSRR